MDSIKPVKKERGFTIVELNITMTLMAVISVGFLAVFTNFLVSSSRTNTKIEMTSDSQNLLRVMVEELRYGAGVRQTNTINDPNGPAGGWNTDNENFVIITAVPALNSADQYIINPATGDPYMNEFVYYKDGTDLSKRTLAHPGATGNKIRTSCPVSEATSECPADRELAQNIKSMTFTLFDQDNNSTSVAANARSILIDLSLEKESFGTPLQYDNSIRITLRNVFS